MGTTGTRPATARQLDEARALGKGPTSVELEPNWCGNQHPQVEGDVTIVPIGLERCWFGSTAWRSLVAAMETGGEEIACDGLYKGGSKTMSS